MKSEKSASGLVGLRLTPRTSEGEARFSAEFERLHRIEKLDWLQDWIFVLQAKYSAILADKVSSWEGDPSATASTLTCEDALNQGTAAEAIEVDLSTVEQVPNGDGRPCCDHASK